MSPIRSGIFWVAIFGAIILIAVLLREILLPFVAGIALAYVLDPLANGLERLGLNRLIATLVILGLFIIGAGIVIFLTAPFLVRELVVFFENSPAYVRRLQVLTSEPARPWLRKLVGEGLGHAEQSLGDLATLAATWLSSVVRSLWSGGQALISILSLAIITPIVACYVLYDWHRMVAAIDGWVPPAHRDTVRALAREVDRTIGGFVRGQSAICLILSLAYALTLSLIGLNHGLLIGIVAGTISFVPYLGSVTALAVSMCVANTIVAGSFRLAKTLNRFSLTGNVSIRYPRSLKNEARKSPAAPSSPVIEGISISCRVNSKRFMRFSQIHADQK